MNVMIVFCLNYISTVTFIFERTFFFIYFSLVSPWLIMFARFKCYSLSSTTLANLSWAGIFCRMPNAKYRTENANAMFACLLAAIISFYLLDSTLL